MTSVTFAARALAGTPPPARDARPGGITGLGRARRTAAKPVRAVERRYSVRSATHAVSVPGPAGRLPLWASRPNLSRPPRPASPGRRPRPGYPSRRRRRSRAPAHPPARPNRCSRRSPGPSRCPRPGVEWSRHLPRGALRSIHRPGVTRSIHGPRGALQSLHRPRGALRNRRAHSASGPGRRPPCRTRPPDQTSPDHQRSPRSRTCWHHYSHRPLRPLRPPLRRLLRSVLNPHSHSWLPSSRRPRLKRGPNHRPRPRSGLNLRPRSSSSHPHPRLGLRPPGPC
jgi:hypothetical protein